VIEASPAEVTEGDEIVVDGHDFTPGSTVTVVYADAEGTVLAENEVTVGDAGTFRDTLVVPEGVALGELLITATGEGEAASDTVLVVAVGGDGGLPVTGASTLALGAVAALALLGGVCVLRSRRFADSM